MAVSLPIDINAQPDITDKQPEIKANSPEEEKELKLLNKFLEQAKKTRAKYDENWERNDNYYDGKQWFGKQRPKYRASPNANVIRPAIQTILPILTDTEPSIDVLPTEPRDYKFAEILSKVVRSYWHRHSMGLTMVGVLTDTMKKDIGYLKCIWNPDLENGAGDIDIPIIDPKNIYVPEGAVDFTKDCPWAIELYPATVGELKRKYSDKAEFIRATGSRQEKTSSPTNTEIKVVSPVDKDEGLEQPNVSTTDTEYDIVWCAELWIDDYAIEEIESEVNGEKVVESVRKYPHGKVVQAIPSLKLILDVGENPYKDGRKPYVRFIDVVRPREFYGEGEISPYVETQDLINRTLAVIYDYVAMITNPVWIIDNDSGVKPSQLTNQVGLIIKKQHGTEVRRESPPDMPAKVFEFYNMMRELFDVQSGVHDVTQGRKPKGITAAEAIETMQEAAQTRIRLKERNMKQSLEQLGQLIVSRILQFYKSPRIIKITGVEEWPQFFEFYTEETSEGYRYKTMEYKYNPETEQYAEGRNVEVGESKGMFDIEVMAGTSLPFLKAQRSTLALRLLEAGVIDQQAVLDSVDFPEKEQIIKRMEEKAAQMAEQEAAMQGAPPQGAM